jgi:hypothetical protein
MSYYYQDSQYEDYGNQGNENYEYEYESYLDHAEPDHWEPDHTPSETEYHDYEPDPTPYEPYHHEEYDVVQHHDDANYGDGPDEWETEHETYEREVHEPEGFGYGESDVYEHTGLIDDDYGRGHECQGPGYDHGDGYGHDDEDDTRAFAPADYDNDEPPIPCLLDPTDPIPTYVHPCFFTPAPIPRPHDFHNAYQRGHVTAPNHVQDARTLARANYNARVGYDTAEPDYHNDGAIRGNDGTPIEWETEPMGLGYRDKTHEREPDWEAFERASMEYGDNGGYLREETHEPGTLEHDAHIPAPANYNTSTPADDPDEWYNELGMDTEIYEPWEFEDRPTTTLNNCVKPAILRAAREGNQHCSELLLEEWMRTGNQYDDATNEMWLEQEAAYQERLREYEEACLREDEEFELECERELELEREKLKLKPPPAPTPVQPPVPYTTNQYPQHATITHTKPYTVPRSRLPPWPNKYLNQNRNRYNNNRYTTARKPTRSRPPPWPNQRQRRTPRHTTTPAGPPPRPNQHPTPSPILSIANLRPPPWPNQCHRRRKPHSPRFRPPPWPIIPRHTTQTSQNRRNAQRRVKAKSRIISDKVSI